MDGYVKAAAGVLVALVLYLALEKNTKDIAILIGVAACVMVAMIAVNYIQPLLTFFRTLQSMGNFDTEIISIILRCVGIGILTEIITLICADAGNAALGKTLQLTSGVIIWWLSLPLLTKLIELVEEILLFT